jgi:hypothetical protein
MKWCTSGLQSLRTRECAEVVLHVSVLFRRRKNPEEPHNRYLVAVYKCQEGFSLQDPSVDRLYCSEDKWVGEEPVCTASSNDSLVFFSFLSSSSDFFQLFDLTGRWISTPLSCTMYVIYMYLPTAENLWCLKTIEENGWNLILNITQTQSPLKLNSNVQKFHVSLSQHPCSYTHTIFCIQNNISNRSNQSLFTEKLYEYYTILKHRQFPYSRPYNYGTLQHKLHKLQYQPRNLNFSITFGNHSAIFPAGYRNARFRARVRSTLSCLCSRSMSKHDQRETATVNRTSIQYTYMCVIHACIHIHVYTVIFLARMHTIV